MIDVNRMSENDLWKLFQTTTPSEDGHELPGQRAQEFQHIWKVLHSFVNRHEKRKPLFKLKDESRFYYLHSRSGLAVVPQSALLKVGRIMYARDRDLTVQYLGTNPRSKVGRDHAKSGPRDDQPSAEAKTRGRKTARRVSGLKRP